MKAAAALIGSIIVAGLLGTAPAPARVDSATVQLGGRSYELPDPPASCSPPRWSSCSTVPAEPVNNWSAPSGGTHGPRRTASPSPTPTAGRNWNAGLCCGQAAGSNINDVGFIEQVVNDVSTRTLIDRQHVFVTGMSNGAMMALRMVCQTATFRGAASVAARSSRPAPGRPRCCRSTARPTRTSTTTAAGAPGRTASAERQSIGRRPLPPSGPLSPPQVTRKGCGRDVDGRVPVRPRRPTGHRRRHGPPVAGLDLPAAQCGPDDQRDQRDRHRLALLQPAVAIGLKR